MGIKVYRGSTSARQVLHLSGPVVGKMQAAGPEQGVRLLLASAAGACEEQFAVERERARAVLSFSRFIAIDTCSKGLCSCAYCIPQAVLDRDLAVA